MNTGQAAPSGSLLQGAVESRGRVGQEKNMLCACGERRQELMPQERGHLLGDPPAWE